MSNLTRLHFVARTLYFRHETGKEVDPQLMKLRTESEMDVLSREKITLAPGVEGHYIVRNWGGPSTPMSGSVIWEQDGFIYSVRGPGSIFEEDKHWNTELIDIARSMASSSLPSKSSTMTWQELKTFVEQKKPPSLEGMVPDQFPNQFANGKIAITRLHPGLVGYVVAKEGVNIPNLSNLKELSETDVSFNSVGSDTVKKLIKGFIKESGNKSAINIFTSEPALQGVFSLDFLDKNKLAEVLYELVKYSSKLEKDPTKNPFLGAFKDVSTEAASIGIENALDRYILPGLGTVARGVRVGGNAVNTYARSADYRNAMINGDKSTIILKDK